MSNKMILFVIRDRKREFVFLIITQCFALMQDSFYLLEPDIENQNQVYKETADTTLHIRLVDWDDWPQTHKVWLNQLILFFWTVLLTQTRPQPNIFM